MRAAAKENAGHSAGHDTEQHTGKTLVLGAAGFIGTNLCNALTRQGADLILFDRFFAEDKTAMWAGKAQLLTGSFDGQTDFDQLTEGVETVYHLISTTCPTNSNLDIAAEYTDNVLPTVRLLDACVRSGVKRVVFLSSGGTVYGKDHTGVCREEDDAFPISSYGVQKLTIEKLLYLYEYLHGLDYRIVRLSNPYGPHQRPDGVQGVVTTFLYRTLKGEPIRLYGDGSVVRDYIYIDDAVRGILAIAADGAPRRLYNLGSGQGTSVAQLIELLPEVTGIAPVVEHLPARAADVPVNILDVARFHADYDIGAFLPLKEGMRRTVEFFRNAGI
ncbi:MAG: NAD-dependent epimerase/dehydratase family protein [Lachnospiraceae bacterium]|nr:NAD-dependent epimerase/dehydratase family protein [Lachnospiraceae bacterium]